MSLRDPVSETTPIVYAGREFAYELRGKSPAQRAAIAAVCNDLHIIHPTTTQLALLFRTSIATVHAARALSAADRELVRLGLRPLEFPEARLARVIRRVGVERSFDVLCQTL